MFTGIRRMQACHNHLAHSTSWFSERPGSRGAPPPLNAAIHKRRQVDSVISPLKGAPGEQTPTTDKSDISSPNKSPATPGQSLHNQINDILTTIPANIQLKSNQTLTSPNKKTSRMPASRDSSLRSIKSPSTPALTLVPVNADEAPSHGVGSDAGMYYNLTAPGKGAPIKLFIRRTGDRVVVRVGGGWADLRQHLLQYAEHHGHRTVSGGNLEVHDLFQRHDTPRPGSALSSYGAPASTPYSRAGSETPGPTPDSVNSTGSARHSWTGDEMGLAGPNAKKLDLSGDKLDWVEGMIDQAKRKVSAPKKPDLKESGRTASGTKRVFLRAPSRAE